MSDWIRLHKNIWNIGPCWVKITRSALKNKLILIYKQAVNTALCMKWPNVTSASTLYTFHNSFFLSSIFVREATY